MTALSLHHAIFTHEKDPDLTLRTASSFLHSVPEGDGNPAGQLFTSSAYQDLIQRQPTHPDGPTLGWDLGLNLLGDPITAAEHKSSQDHQIKMKLRRLHAISIALELLFGIWGTYTTVRYCLASVDGVGDSERVCALVLGIFSALALAFVIIATLMPLFPQQNRPHIWQHTRSLLRACYLLFLLASAGVNLVLVMAWHPTQLCSWDIDVSWYTSTVNTITSPCHTASFAVWMVAAILRVVVTLTVILLFIYTLHSYHRVGHPNSENGPKYTPYLTSDPEEMSPVLTSAPLHLSKSSSRFTRSADSTHTLSQSISTLPKSNSISTLAPSTSCTGHSLAHSTPPSKDIMPPRISPPISHRTSTQTVHGTSPMPFGSEAPLQTQPVDSVTSSWSTSPLLRRSSRIPVTQMTSDMILPDTSLRSDRHSGPMIACDPSEIRSSISWKPSRRGTTQLDVGKSALAWENVHIRHTSQDSVSSESFSPIHDDGESIQEMDRQHDILMYSYGYGATEPTYPYLEVYNPQRPGEYSEAPSLSEDLDERVLSRGYRRAIPGGPMFPEVSSEPRSSLSRDDEESSGEEEEYVAMMGGFVRRMATIESLGSREAAGTVSTTGSVAHLSIRSRTPVSQFSSARFTEYGASGASSDVPSTKEGSLSTAYLSFSSGGTGMRVNERGELVLYPSRNTTGSPHDRLYFTASGSTFPGTDDEDR